MRDYIASQRLAISSMMKSACLQIYSYWFGGSAEPVDWLNETECDKNTLRRYHIHKHNYRACRSLIRHLCICQLKIVTCVCVSVSFSLSLFLFFQSIHTHTHTSSHRVEASELLLADWFVSYVDVTKSNTIWHHGMTHFNQWKFITTETLFLNEIGHE